MTMRITGMYSGLDTESIIQELVKARSTKVEKLKKDKTKLEWKQEAWSSLNTKIKSFQGKISELRFSTAYKKKTTSVSNSSAVSVITGENAMNGVQSLSIKKLAKSGYMTGAKLNKADGSAVTGDTKISELALKDAAGNAVTGLPAINGSGSFSITANGVTKKVDVTADTTISEMAGLLKNAGVDANFDEKNGRIFIASSSSGTESDFAITADNAIGFTALSVLGINESLGANLDADKNENLKTLKTYQALASFSFRLASIGTKEVPYTEDVEKKDADGNTILDDEGNPVMETVEKTKTVLDTEDFFAGLSVDDELYKAIKGELEDPAKTPTTEELDAAIARLTERAAFAGSVLDTSIFTESMYSGEAVRIAGQDAKIELNGVEYTSGTNNIEVNGITFTALSEADDITVTTQDDTDGIYDMIRDIFKAYNELINEIDKLYNADAATKFEPLTDEEKEEMSEKEIEKWEQKIKDSILRKDTTLGTFSQSVKNIMLQGFEVNGTKMYLSNFGIETMSYFLAAENEKNAFHIAGNSDDPLVSGNADKLKTMIANEPDKVVSFFTQLSRELSSKFDDLSAMTDDSSFGSFYADKKYKSDISSFETKVSEAEKKLAAYEDKYYKKFSDMEVALSKLESSTSSITSLLGQ